MGECRSILGQFAIFTERFPYEVSFTRYFYKPQPMRTLEEIRADILALEKETDGLLSEIIGEGPQ